MTKKELDELKAKVFGKNTRQDIKLGYGNVHVSKMLELVEALEARVAVLERIKAEAGAHASVIREGLLSWQTGADEGVRYLRDAMVARFEEFMKELIDEQ